MRWTFPECSFNMQLLSTLTIMMQPEIHKVSMRTAVLDMQLIQIARANMNMLSLLEKCGYCIPHHELVVERIRGGDLCHETGGPVIHEDDGRRIECDHGISGSDNVEMHTSVCCIDNLSQLPSYRLLGVHCVTTPHRIVDRFLVKVFVKRGHLITAGEWRSGHSSSVRPWASIQMIPEMLLFINDVK